MTRTLPLVCLAPALALTLCLGACSPSVPSQAQIQAASPATLQNMESQLRQSQKDHPQDARVLLQLSRVLLRRGALAEAEQLALQADQQAPAQGEILGVLAQIYLAQDKRFRALTTASQAVQFEPDLLSAYVTVARANALLGEPESAFKALNECLRREPRYFPAWYTRASIQFSGGLVREAEATIQQALRIEPSSKEGLLLQIRIVKREGRLSSAGYLIQSALKVWPEDGDLLQELLDLYRQRQDWTFAQGVLERLQRLGPLTPESTLTQLQMLQAQGQAAAYKVGLDALLASNPRLASAWLLQAKGFLGQNRPDAALVPLNRAVDLDPGLVEARFWLAVAFFETGDTLQGNAAMAELTRLAPDYPPLRLLRIRRLLAEHRLDLAAPLLSDFLRDYPSDVEALLLRSEWLTLSGSYSEAGKILDTLPPTWDARQLDFAKARLAYLQAHYRTVLTYTQHLDRDPVLSWREAYLRGFALARLGNTKDALTLLQPYLKVPDGEGRFYRLMGDISQIAGDRRAAERVYTEGLLQYPRSALLLDAISRLDVEAENWQDARGYLERGLELNSTYRAVFMERLILVYAKLGNAAASRAMREKYMEVADPVLAETFRTEPESVLFGMTQPPLEPVYRASAVERVPAPVVPAPGTVTTPVH